MDGVRYETNIQPMTLVPAFLPCFVVSCPVNHMWNPANGIQIHVSDPNPGKIRSDRLARGKDEERPHPSPVPTTQPETGRVPTLGCRAEIHLRSHCRRYEGSTRPAESTESSSSKPSPDMLTPPSTAPEQQYERRQPIATSQPHTFELATTCKWRNSALLALWENSVPGAHVCPEARHCSRAYPKL